MTEKLHIRTFQDDRLFAPHLKDILTHALVPVQAAEAADPVALIIPFEHSAAGRIYVQPIIEVILMGPTGPKRTRIMNLPKYNPRLVPLALCALDLSTQGLPLSFLTDIVHEMNPSDDVDQGFEIALFIDGAYVVPDDAQESLLEPLSWDQIYPSQSDIDRCARLVTLPCASAHERLHTTPTLMAIHEIAMQIFPLRWNEEDPLHLPPNLSDWRSLALA